MCFCSVWEAATLCIKSNFRSCCGKWTFLASVIALNVCERDRYLVLFLFSFHQCFPFKTQCIFPKKICVEIKCKLDFCHFLFVLLPNKNFIFNILFLFLCIYSHMKCNNCCQQESVLNGKTQCPQLFMHCH